MTEVTITRYFEVEGRTPVEGLVCPCCQGPMYEDPVFSKSLCEDDGTDGDVACPDVGSRLVSCPGIYCHAQLVCRSAVKPGDSWCPTCRKEAP